jgi:thiol-disulfide isomerase/thioredoxin
MKSWKSIVLLFFIVLLSACGRPDATDIYSRPIKFSDFGGKWIVINYWATWCAPCIQQLSVLNSLAKNYPGQLVVFGVNSDNIDSSALPALSDSYQVGFLFLRYLPMTRWSPNRYPLPVTYILDKKGHLYKILQGFQTLEAFKSTMGLPDVIPDN